MTNYGSTSGDFLLKLEGTAATLTDVAVISISAPASVVQGDVVSMDVTVQNVGDQEVASFDVTLLDLTDAVTIGTQTVASLTAGGSATLTYTWNTAGASIGSHTLEGRHYFADDNSANDFSTAAVIVEAPLTDVVVISISAPASVVQGDVVSMDVTVQNVGNQEVGSFDVTLLDLTDAVAIGTQTVASLTAGGSATLTYTWNTAGASIGSHTLEGRHYFADDNSANDFSTAAVTIDEARIFTLSATGYKVKGLQKADLDWSGAAANTDIRVVRDGSEIATGASTSDGTGFYTDNIDQRGGGSYTYQVCEVDHNTGQTTTICSNEVTVTF